MSIALTAKDTVVRIYGSVQGGFDLRGCPNPEQLARDIADRYNAAGNPIDVVMYCPKCNTQHIDAPETEAAYFTRRALPKRWMNPPHKSHLCAACKFVWRPSDHPTNGITATVSGKDADTRPDPTALFLNRDVDAPGWPHSIPIKRPAFPWVKVDPTVAKALQDRPTDEPLAP